MLFYAGFGILLQCCLHFVASLSVILSLPTARCLNVGLDTLLSPLICVSTVHCPDERS